MSRRLALLPLLPALALLLVLVLVGAPLAADEVPLSTAKTRLQELRRCLKRHRTENRKIAAALAEVEDAYLHVGPDPEPEGGNADRWQKDQATRIARFRSHTEKLFLKALALKKVNRELDLNERHEIQFQAARALGRARPCVAEGFRRVLEKDVFGDHDYRKKASFYDVALRALASLDDPQTFDWLLKRGVNADVNDEAKHRALAALEVMMDLPAVTGEQRRGAVRRLIDIYQSYAFHWQNKYDAVAGFRSGHRKYVKIAGIQGTYWMDVRPVVLRALRQFSQDPRTGHPPVDRKTGLEWETIPDWLNWYHKVGRKGMPPWIDAPARDPTGAKQRAELGPQAPSGSSYERDFGVAWQRWWQGHARPPHRTIRAAGGDGARTRFLQALRETRLPDVFTAALQSESYEIRAAAALSLGKVRAPTASKTLTSLFLEETHERVREAALLGLLCLRDLELKEFFRDVLHDPEENARCRAYALLALGHLGEGHLIWSLFGERRPAIEASPTLLADLQACAVAAVGLSGDADLAPSLMKVLASRRWAMGTRGHVGGALARLGNAEVVPDLLTLLRRIHDDDDEAPVAASTVLALGALVRADDTRNIRRLAAPLLKPKGKYGGTRNAIAMALGQVGGAEAEKLLTAAWAQRVKDTTRYAERAFLLIALARIDTTTALASVRHQVRTLEHEHDLAAGAIAIAMAGDRLGIAPVREKARAAKHILKRYGFLALGMLGDDDVGPLARRELLRNHEPALVRQALTALALAEGANALPDLEAWWPWSPSHAHKDALAWAFVPAASPGAEAFLTRWATDEGLEPRVRAYALLALGRMADPDPRPVLTRIGRDLNPYVDTPTLSLLARYADVPFFR